MQKEKIIKSLRDIPGVDKILLMPEIKALLSEHGQEIVKYSINNILKHIRKDIRGENKSWKKSKLISQIKNRIQYLTNKSLKRVINATGVVLHTNLGRAPLGEKVLEELIPIIKGYCNLEFDLETGNRGDRNDHITELIKYVTGAEAALVVNNNAAAVLLSLMIFAKNNEVIVSRGELIEIGGSFRLPDVMKASGAVMKEVGTTNRTKLSDYQNAITDKTSIIFKAHKSNYYINGFTKEVPVSELTQLAHGNDLIMVYDVGSGLLRRPNNVNLSKEPAIKTILEEGADIVCFSGDKLLGGTQSGIIAGKKKYVSVLAKAPLFRALRVDKLTIAALSTVIKFYLKESNLKYNKLFEILETPLKIIKEKAIKLKKILQAKGIKSVIEESKAKVGGGTVPAKEIHSYAVRLTDLDKKGQHERIFAGLLKVETPIVSILREGNIVFDVLTIDNSDLPYLADSIQKIMQK